MLDNIPTSYSKHFQRMVPFENLSGFFFWNQNFPRSVGCCCRDLVTSVPSWWNGRPLLLDNVASIQQSAALALGRLANFNETLAESVSDLSWGKGKNGGTTDLEWNDWNDWNQWGGMNGMIGMIGMQCGNNNPSFGDSRPFRDGLRSIFFNSGRDVGMFMRIASDQFSWNLQHLATSGCNARSSSTAGLFVGATKSSLNGFGVELPENPWWGPCEVWIFLMAR